jgi:hypothetical protein
MQMLVAGKAAVEHTMDTIINHTDGMAAAAEKTD